MALRSCRSLFLRRIGPLLQQAVTGAGVAGEGQIGGDVVPEAPPEVEGMEEDFSLSEGSQQPDIDTSNPVDVVSDSAVEDTSKRSLEDAIFRSTFEDFRSGKLTWRDVGSIYENPKKGPYRLRLPNLTSGGVDSLIFRKQTMLFERYLDKFANYHNHMSALMELRNDKPGFTIEGEAGAGKSVLMNQIAQMAHAKKILVFHCPSLVDLTHGAHWIEPSPLYKGMFDNPTIQERLMQSLMGQADLLAKIPITFDEELPVGPGEKSVSTLLDLLRWSKVSFDRQPIGFKLMMDCITNHSTVPILFLLDGYNGLYGESAYRWGPPTLTKFTPTVHSNQFVLKHCIHRLLYEISGGVREEGASENNLKLPEVDWDEMREKHRNKLVITAPTYSSNHRLLIPVYPERYNVMHPIRVEPFSESEIANWVSLNIETSPYRQSLRNRTLPDIQRFIKLAATHSKGNLTRVNNLLGLWASLHFT